MERFEDIMNVVDSVLEEKQNRHIIGGLLLSVSLLFGGLAFTIITLKEDTRNER